jgi:hypothetical protein
MALPLPRIGTPVSTGSRQRGTPSRHAGTGSAEAVLLLGARLKAGRLGWKAARPNATKSVLESAQSFSLVRVGPDHQMLPAGESSSMDIALVGPLLESVVARAPRPCMSFGSTCKVNGPEGHTCVLGSSAGGGARKPAAWVLHGDRRRPAHANAMPVVRSERAHIKTTEAEELPPEHRGALGPAL